jgi:hypothetical protein
LCRERGIQPVWLLLPTYPGEEDLPAGRANADVLLRLAREAGLPVMNLLDVYEGHDPTTLHVAMWDRHPNQRGHQLIADRLYQLLRETPNGLLPGLAIETVPASPARATPAGL